MKKSVEKVLDRGERIELLIDRTDHLQHNAFRFAQGSTALKRSLRWRSLRCYLMLGGAACFLAGLLILVGCGSFDVQECTRGPAERALGSVGEDPRDWTERLTAGASDFFVLSKMSLYHRGDKIAHLPPHARLQAALEPPLGAALRVHGAGKVEHIAARHVEREADDHNGAALLARLVAPRLRADADELAGRRSQLDVAIAQEAQRARLGRPDAVCARQFPVADERVRP